MPAAVGFSLPTIGGLTGWEHRPIPGNMENMSLTDQRPSHTARQPISVHRHRGLFSGATWRELLYAIIDLPLTIAFFTISVVLLTVGVGLTVIYVGIPIVMVGIAFALGGGALYRDLGRKLLDLPVLSPGRRVRRHSGVTGLVRDTVTDSAAWRAVSYLLIKIVLAPVTFALAVSFYSGFGMVTYPIWRPFLPAELGSDGQWHHGAQIWSGMYIDTWPLMAMYVAIGLAMVLLAPHVVRWVLGADRHLITALLGDRHAGDERAH